MATHATARLDEIEVLADGPSRYRPVRHHFGITSFGATGWVGAEEGDLIINEYDEESEPAEELFVVFNFDVRIGVDGTINQVDVVIHVVDLFGDGRSTKAVVVIVSAWYIVLKFIQECVVQLSTPTKSIG